MIGRFDTIFWDIDGTLLDFEASAAVSLRLCLERQGATATQAQYARYHAINAIWWERLERGEVTRAELYPGRFAEWFEAVGLTGIDPVRMNRDYQEFLGETPVTRPGALEVLRALKPWARQYAATNGSIVAQEKKLRLTGIDALMDGVFISERMGVDKPNKEYFDLCAAEIAGYSPERAVIIGDSLTSDMRGGNNAGIACVWFCPEGGENRAGVRVDAVARSLDEIPDILRRL